MLKSGANANAPSPPRKVPSARRYVSALSAVEKRITRNQRRLLELHHGMPCLITTARDLAIAVGFKDYGAANVQYGLLGSLIADELGMSFRGVSVLVLMAPPLTGTNTEWLWVMRQNVALALEDLGWVPGSQRDFFPWEDIPNSAPNKRVQRSARSGD